MPDSSVHEPDFTTSTSPPPPRQVALKSSEHTSLLRKLPGMRTLFSIILIVACLIGGGFVTWLVASMREDPKRAEPVERSHIVQVYEAETVTIQEMITGFGTARAMQEVILSAQVSGEIVETIVPLKIGKEILAASFQTDVDGVSKQSSGDLIARIDPQTYQQRVEQAEDLLNEDQAELNRLEQEQKNLAQRLQIAEKNFNAFMKEYQRVENLVRQEIASPSDLTTAELDLRKYEDAKVQLETELALMPQKIKQVEAKRQTRRNDLELAKLEFERTAVTSPISGQLSKISVEKGQYVRVGDPLVTVTSKKQVEIPIGIAMEDYLKIIPQIAAGQYPTARISTRRTADAYWEGLVPRASPTADTQTRTVDVFVVVDNENSASPLLPGTFVTVQIEGPMHENVIAIPRDAVIDDEILLAQDGKVVTVPIKKTIDIQTIRILKDQLTPGDQIIMTNLDILKPGDAIKIPEDSTQTLEDEMKRMQIPNFRIFSQP